MRAKYSRIPEKTKLAVCRDYLRGEKVIVIKMEHGVDYTSIYNILRQKKVELRRGSGENR